MEPLTVSMQDAAQLLGIGERWLRDAAAAGKVPHVKLGVTRRFTHAQLVEILQAHTEGRLMERHPWGRTPGSVRADGQRPRGPRT